MLISMMFSNYSVLNYFLKGISVFFYIENYACDVRNFFCGRKKKLVSSPGKFIGIFNLNKKHL